MNIFKKPGRILLTIMIVLAVVCPYRVHIKQKLKRFNLARFKLMICRMQHRIFIHIQHI